MVRGSGDLRQHFGDGFEVAHPFGRVVGWVDPQHRALHSLFAVGLLRVAGSGGRRGDGNSDAVGGATGLLDDRPEFGDALASVGSSGGGTTYQASAQSAALRIVAGPAPPR